MVKSCEQDGRQITCRKKETWATINNTTHHCTASQPRRPRLEFSPPWKPQISQRLLDGYNNSEAQLRGRIIIFQEHWYLQHRFMSLVDIFQSYNWLITRCIIFHPFRHFRSSFVHFSRYVYLLLYVTVLFSACLRWMIQWIEMN